MAVPWKYYSLSFVNIAIYMQTNTNLFLMKGFGNLKCESYDINATSTTSTTINPANVGNTFLAATCTATEPPMLHEIEISGSLIMIVDMKKR